MTQLPRKRFGQHFLHDPAVIERIVRAIDPRPGDTIIEIGPGHGAITLPLLQKHGTLEAVELDRNLVPLLREKATGHGELLIHEADALKFDFRQRKQAGSKLKIVGNLPYNVSTPLLFHLLGQIDCISAMYFMLQKEVVDRMAASPGNKRYGRLTVMLAVAVRVEKLFTIGTGAFKPPPAVESAFCTLTPWPQPPFEVSDSERFRRLVTQAFSARRKTLRNALKGMVTVQQINGLGIDPGLRPENLSPAQFAALAALA
ncbi:MAG: 16S rRNA (adenine(1518)-N(6)/adenine(1519)-N(6))-dimethyltransferase RsmA [Gammaproteobacteria bacterium]|nr:16S rRNA (adenine(1518)-N(6)/adenine(1519)-N(6))-dimethyltransferase RsmA [Gammaproteobacteria bacterium]MCZ6717451.1 16S rRNA (adenine(1518)-N(6)/adenine(1519)-N(6))-dimethyltransferase RsmA [Gammaproteobacteria bacterium]MCZ6911481.1 16S rRNA (adenine(1518)-N(6)/adenine(1519)-N(6))-dimethyltransferase RsmA [Pseudomonadota bacterium]